MMLYLNEENPKTAVKVLQNNEVLALPTETVYGIAVVYDNKDAFDEMVKVKKRSPEKPFALACSSMDEAMRYIEVDERIEKLMRKFLPGEITFLVNAKKSLPWHVTLGTNVIGIRVPAYDYILEVIKELGKPILLTSANISGQPTSRNYEEVLSYFDGKIGGIVKGECTSLIPSTIVNVTNGEVKLVREGPITFDEINNAWEELK